MGKQPPTYLKEILVRLNPVIIGLTQSMSKKGNSLDNADALIERIKVHIEYYNTKRIKVKLKEYRTQALNAV